MTDLIRSEWTKLRSVRSTYVTMTVATILMLGLGYLACRSAVASWEMKSAQARAELDPLETSIAGGDFAQFAFGILGVLAITTEYGTGMIRTTFAAVPRRRAVLLAKALVVGGLALLIGEVLTFSSFLLGQSVLSSEHAGISLGDPGVLRAVAGGGLYICVLALVGFGLGALLRHTAAAMSVFVFLLFLVIAVTRQLPGEWRARGDKLTLIGAVNAIMSRHQDPTLTSVGVGYAVLAGYVVVLLGLPMMLANRRDA